MSRLRTVGIWLTDLLCILWIAGCAGSPLDNALGISPQGKQHIADEKFAREEHVCELNNHRLQQLNPEDKQRVVDACSFIRNADPGGYIDFLYAEMLLELAGPNGSDNPDSRALHQQGEAIMWNFVDSARGNFVGTAFFHACVELRDRSWPHDRLCSPFEFARANAAARVQDEVDQEARRKQEMMDEQSMQEMQEQMQERMRDQSLERPRNNE
jgi:hypothetical protein